MHETMLENYRLNNSYIDRAGRTPTTPSPSPAAEKFGLHPGVSPGKCVLLTASLNQ